MKFSVRSLSCSLLATALALSATLGEASSSSAKVAAPQERHQVTAERGRGGMAVVQVMIDGHGPFRFGIDTGAPGPLRIDTSVAEKAGLKILSHELEGDGTGKNECKVPVVRVSDLSMGTFRKAGLEANVMDLKGRGFEYDGLFGMDAFADHVLTLDYANGIVAADKGSLPPANGKDVIDYELTQDGIIKLKLTMAGREVDAYLDTGQTMTGILVSEDLAHAVASGPPRAAGKARTVSNVYQMYEVTLEGSVFAGGVRLPVDRVRYPSTDGNANIGSLALAGGVLRIDQRNRRLQIIFPKAAS